MTHGPMSKLDLAADRLRAFMEKYSATLDEVAAITGILKPRLKQVLSRYDRIIGWDEEVILQLGSQMIDITLHKLRVLRGEEPVDTPPQKENPAMSYASDSIQAKAMKAFDELREACPDAPVTALALQLGYESKNALHQRRNQFKKHALSDEAAQEMLARIRSYLDKKPLAPAEEPTGSDPADQDQEAAQGDTTGKHQLPNEQELDTLIPEDTNHEGWTEIPDEAVRIAAVKLVEATFGIDLEEMKALRAPIEHMAVCRRNGIRCSVVTDAIEVR